MDVYDSSSFSSWLEHLPAQEKEKVKIEENMFAIVDDIQTFLPLRRPSRINGFCIFLCLNGSCTLSINLHSQVIGANMMLITFPPNVLEIVDQSPDFTCKFLFVTGNFVQNNISQGCAIMSVFLFAKEHPCVKLDPSEVTFLCEYFRFLLQRLSYPNLIFRKEIATGILTSLFYGACSYLAQYTSVNTTVMTRRQELFEKFLDYVYQHFKEERSLSYYADQMCLTPKYLSSVIKEATGHSAADWINQLVVMEAKVLLRNSARTVQQVAMELHFANQSFFGKYFKQQTGISPNTYRRQQCG